LTAKKIIASLVIIVIILSLGLLFFLYNPDKVFLFIPEEMQSIKQPVLGYFNMINAFNDITQKNQKHLDNLNPIQADKLIHQELTKYYKTILTGAILKRYSENITHCSLFSEDYSVFFSSLENVKIGKITVKRMGFTNVICKVIYKSKEESDFMEYINYDIKNLVKNYKIANYTQDQLNLAKYGDFVLYINNESSFYLEKINDKWFIYDIKNKILGSKIKLITSDEI